ncbi:MAG: glucosyl transferase [Ignavibacterium sp.]|nr:glucosyl transferase [Ignavibacterium sp.]
MGISQKLLHSFFIFFFFLFLLCTASCSTTEPPTPPDEPIPVLILELDDVSCTETWINLTTKDLTLPAELTLKQYNPSGDSISKALLLNTQDTLLYIDSLLPNQTYKFHSVIQSINNSSNEINVTTMDTTSHDFSFQTWTFGTIGSSVLYDVAIINENNIIAVGEILVADSSPNGYTKYNAVHWDGNQWDLLRVPYNYQGTDFFHPIKSVFAFNADNIWFCGNGVIKWNGVNYSPIPIPVWGPYQMNKIWGSSSNDLYIVGNNGSIAHYNGTAWKKIESGTDLNINDIWGDYSEKTGEWEILAVGEKDLPVRQGIFSIEKNDVMQISSYNIQWSLYAVWFKTNRRYYVIGSGIYEKKFLNDPIWKDNGFNISHYATTGIRGNRLNDVFVAGAFGEFLHFNGLNWRSYINELSSFSGSYGGIAVKNNLVVTVGYEGAQAKILLGKRIN